MKHLLLLLLFSLGCLRAEENPFLVDHTPKAPVLEPQHVNPPIQQVAVPLTGSQRIAWCAPLAEIFFFIVLLILAVATRVQLHPSHWPFLAASSLSFQVLYAYSAESAPTLLSLGIACGVSLGLITKYLNGQIRQGFGWVSLLAQFAYVGMFSYSHFVDLAAGVLMTLVAVAVLAALRLVRAESGWSVLFGDLATGSQGIEADRKGSCPLPISP